MMDSWFFFPLLIEACVFLLVFPLNYYGFTLLSRILLCWIPPAILIIDLEIMIVNLPVPETSHYLGMRIFQIAFSFFPFLIFNLSEKWKMFMAVIVPLLLSIFFDDLLELLDVGYSEMGLAEPSYYYNNFRTVLVISMISASFIFLKRILERQEELNTRIVNELAEKNTIIQSTAESQVRKAHVLLKHHMNATPLAVIERDKNFSIIFWNKQAEHLFGWTEEEVTGLRPQDFMVDPRDQLFVKDSITRALDEKRESKFIEVRIVAKNGKVLNCLWYYSFVRNDQGELETVLSFVTDITEQKRSNYFLNERVKELTTLYNVSQLLTSEQESMYTVFHRLPQLLPPGWQFPDICSARLVAFDGIFQTESFNDSNLNQSIELTVDGRQIGSLTVSYHEPVPDYAEVFLLEEKSLLATVAQMLQVYIERKMEEEELRRTQANLTGIINNTEMLIWSVNADFTIIGYNEAARVFALQYYKVDVSTNKTVHAFPEAVRGRWVDRYTRVLQGEILHLEERQFGFDLKFSLSPILEEGKPTGVVVFVDNISEAKQQAAALTEANKKIADLKVMALRSVMNPHFVFNVLSSIQYFITKNDELNAINYLTAFSKLMRTVLTRSVADLVTLKEEIDLLKEYVHLEKLRFDDKFDFLVLPKEDLDMDEIKIPSLLIQPYVENAILHGLYNKEGKGSLSINVNLVDEHLIFIVEDDGVGREAARKVRARNPAKTQSMGTQLTEERLNIINGDNQPAVIYTDLFKDNEPFGTRVTIRIKINPN
jgi:PAS domain S-box-containing protein